MPKGCGDWRIAPSSAAFVYFNLTTSMLSAWTELKCHLHVVHLIVCLVLLRGILLNGGFDIEFGTLCRGALVVEGEEV